MAENETKTLSPKLDIVFQAIFGEEESITKNFLEILLERKINKIDLNQNPILRKECKDEKLGILDILAELDESEKCNIELQIVNKKNIIERILFYWSRIYSKQIKSGEDYSKLKRTIIVLIADFKIDELEEVGYHSLWKIMETKNKIILTNKLEIDIIELPKIEGKENVKDELLDWLYFLENPKGERVTKKMEENKELKKAVKKLDRISEDRKMQRIAELREKAIRDEKATYAKGEEVGTEKTIIEMEKNLLALGVDIETIYKAAGVTEEEMNKIDGLTREKREEMQKASELKLKAERDEKSRMLYAKEQGEQIGEKRGRKEGKIEIAKNMIKEKMPIETIEKITGLSKEEIEKIEK